MASFWFSASFRIHGTPYLHPEIIATLGLGDEHHQGFGLPPDLLAIFSRLNLRLEVSIMT